MLSRKKPLSQIFRLIVAFLILSILGGSCKADEPILLGLSVKLTGARGELGVEIRNGAQLAVEQINANGGINGRPIELITVNDKGDHATAQQVDADLLDQNVVAIIGHVTSSQTAAALPQMNEAKTILFSPTSTSDLFNAQDDYFFRSTLSTTQWGTEMANYIYQTLGPVKISGIYDSTNAEFTTYLWQAFQEQFTSLGGQIGSSYEYTSDQTEIKPLMEQVSQDDADGILFIVAAVDQALMAQYGRQMGMKAEYYSSLWAHTNELLQKGGSAVEGITLFSTFNTEDENKIYLDFANQFEQDYGYPPDLFSVSGYEAVIILAKALEKTGGKAEGLKEALSEIGTVESVLGPITLDAYGDATRNIYVEVIHNRQYELQTVITP